ncbi:MAG TPA: insulinase family protein [Rhizomicrobium sp.]|jgi:zinc protease
MRRGLIAAALCALCLGATPSLAFDAKNLPAPHGEQVWFAEDHTLPMIAMVVAVPAGSGYDPIAKPGLASFAADLLDEGAGKLNSQAFHTALSNRAIRLSISVEHDYMLIQLVTLSENAKDAFQLLGLALAHPRFEAEAINRVRTQILANLEQQSEDPATVAGKAFFRAYFHNHPYAHSLGGDAKSVMSIQASDLKAFAATHWVQPGLKISVSGDVNAATLQTLLKSAFGQMPRRMPPYIPPVGRVGQPGVTVIPMQVAQSVAVFGMPGMLRNDRDFIPGYVANYIVGGGGFASRLTTEVRVKRGLTYDISTSLDALHRAGYVVGEVATKRGSMRQTIDVVRQTLKDFAAKGPTDKELADAKTYLTGAFPLAFGSNVGIAGQMNAFQRAGLDIGYLARRNALIDAVTLDDVKRAAKRLFNPRRMTVVVAGTMAGVAAHAPPQPGVDKPAPVATPTKPAPHKTPVPAIAAKPKATIVSRPATALAPHH